MEYRKINHLIAVVIWYNPSTPQVDAISHYIQDVARVIIVDNSNQDNAALCPHDDKIEYIPLGANRGIARALNIGCQRAMDLGADWVLTMDQDSLWLQCSVSDFVEEAQQYNEWDKVAIFFPMQYVGVSMKDRHKGRFVLSPRAMTSGNLLRLAAWKQVGEFLEDFFIDSVDDELNCRLTDNRWQIVRVGYLVMNHSLGEGTHFLPGTKHPYTAHRPFRYYYIARNMRRMMQLHPNQASYYRLHIWRELKRLSLYDWNDKWAKLRQFLRGWRDGLQPYPTPFTLTLAPQAQDYRQWLEQLPSSFFTDGQVIYDARNQIRVFTLPNGEQVNVKRFCRPNCFMRLIYSTIRQPKAQRAFNNALYLKQHRVPTPDPIAYILCGNKWLNESYLVTRQMTYTHRFYEFRNHSVKGYEEVIRAFAQLSAQMHQQHILHQDFSPGNILWDKDKNGHIQLCIVDINRLSITKPLSTQDCCKNFRRLWGHKDFIHLLSQEYARARQWEEYKTEQRITRYWKRFWHIHSDSDIERVFQPIPLD